MMSVRLRKLVVFSVFLALLFLAIATTALSNGETSPSYVSVRALDSYGNAIQVGHAKEAAQRYGRSVVVAVVEVYDEQKNSTEKTISSSRPEEEEHQEKETKGKPLPSSSFLIVVSFGNSPVLHPVQLPIEANDSGSSSMLAMCFTGVKGDANWLLQQMQKYAANVWERYDMSAMSAPIVAHVVARLLGRFAAQPENQEWHSTLGLPGKQERDDDRQSSWSRPLGVQTMVLSLSSYSSEHVSQKRLREPGLLIVEPSGVILNPAARSKSGRVSLGAMGKESDKMQARLLRLLRGTSQDETSVGDSSSSSSWEDLPPTHDRCQDALIRILLEETTNINNDNESSQHDFGGDIMVESYSPDRGKIERRLFRYQNANTFAPV